jgi:hypothetical protein
MWGPLKTVLAATCTQDGSGRKTCTVCSAVNNDIVIPAFGHSYGSASYSWSGYSSCTATRTCANNSSHKETATATITSTVTKAATCTTTGTKTYTATFSESWAAKQTKTETISALGHDYGTPRYSWDDGDACQGVRTCKVSSCGHTQSSNGNITFKITTPATCQATGIMTYTATFPDFGNTTSTYTETIPKVDHNWTQSTGTTPGKCSMCNKTVDYVSVELRKKYIITAPSGKVDLTGTWTGNGTSGAFSLYNINTGTSFEFESAFNTSLGEHADGTSYNVYLDTTIGNPTIQSGLSLLPLITKYKANIIITGATSATEVTETQEITLDSSNVHLAGEVDANGDLYLLDTIYIGNAECHVTGIDTSTFEDRTDIQSIYIPEGVTYIGTDAFRSCTNLIYVELPSTLTTLCDSAFYGCESLESIGIPEWVTCIEPMTFCDCYALTSVDFLANPVSSVESIGDLAFASTGIRYIIIPEGVTSIGSQAFYSCMNLELVRLPSTLTRIEDWAFNFCENLHTIIFDGTAEQWYAIEKGDDWDFEMGYYEIVCADGTTIPKESGGGGTGGPVATITLCNDGYGDITINYTSAYGPATLIAPERQDTTFEPVCGTSIFFTDPEDCMYISGADYVSVTGNIYEYIAPDSPGTYTWPVDRS